MKKEICTNLVALFVVVGVGVVFAGPDDRNIDESMASVKDRAVRMVAFCRQKCSFKDDLLERCTRTCMRDYSEQIERFLVRKYTNECSGQSASESFSYKEDDKRKCKDIIATTNARDQWIRNKAVRECAQEKLKEHHRIVQSSLRLASYELKKTKSQLPPVIRKGVEVYQDVRYGKPKDKK